MREAPSWPLSLHCLGCSGTSALGSSYYTLYVVSGVVSAITIFSFIIIDIISTVIIVIVITTSINITVMLVFTIIITITIFMPLLHMQL